ncbi:MAG TPA: hypothetical protein VN455_03955, partial [Methanotrichaceae archaeon]|nr:hypothetical protein [Methanotrichaceae archaeon]
EFYTKQEYEPLIKEKQRLEEELQSLHQRSKDILTTLELLLPDCSIRPENDASYDYSYPGSSGPANQFKINLQDGPIYAEMVDDRASLEVKTPTVTVSSAGRNAFTVYQDSSTGNTMVFADQNPVQVQPNGGIQPFTLDGGQAVLVDQNEIVDIGPSRSSPGGTIIPAAGPVAIGPVAGAGSDPQIPGMASSPLQEGCYRDPQTGDIICVDSRGEPVNQKGSSTSEAGMQGGCYADPQTGEIVCVNSSGESTNPEGTSTYETGMQGGCYADPQTGEIVCVDSNGAPSSSEVVVSTTPA